MKSKKKTTKTAPKKTAPRTKPAAAPQLTASEASLALDVKSEGLEAVFGAAYLMMDKAFVSLSGDRAAKVVVTLRAKDPQAFKPKALAAEFLSDLASQKVRWAIARNNLPVREYIAEQAVLIANGTVPPPGAPAAPEPAVEELTAEQRSEIEKLISEVEAEIKTMNQDKTKPAVSDPKGIRSSWEEKQEQENKA